MKDEIVIKKSQIIKAIVVLGIGVGCFVAGFMTSTLIWIYFR